MILGGERERRITELRPTEGVLRLTRGEEAHPELTPWCRRLAYSTEPEDFAPTGIEVVPLWEGENSITGFFLSSDGRRIFIRYDVEYIEDYVELGCDLESAIRDLLERYVEDANIPLVAASLGYTAEELMGERWRDGGLTSR